MKRILILVVALGLFLCSTAIAFQGGGGESTKKGSTKKKAVTTKKTSGTKSANTTPPRSRASSQPTRTPAPATAELTIRSTPPSSYILVDGQSIGVTDEEGLLKLSSLKPGEHIVIGRKERYRDAQRTVLLEANGNQTAQLDLSPMPGNLNVNLNVSGAQIEIAGKGNYAGTVSSLELESGSYTITASKPGYQTLTQRVEIEAGLRADVSLALELAVEGDPERDAVGKVSRKQELALELAVEGDPELAFEGRESYQAGGRNWTRYKLTVTNRTAYSQDLFASAPDLPPCGLNTKSSRTWVDIYDQRGNRLYGFCALTKPSDLSSLWFALPAGQAPPSQVFVVLKDRRSNKEYKSNLVAIR